MKEGKTYKLKHIIVAIIVTLSLTTIFLYLAGQTIIDNSYNSGYEDGYDEGHEDGRQDGYNIGYNDGHDDSFSTTDNYTESSYSDEIPNTAVFVTPHGEKYHESWCQYVSNRTDISYYNTADEALSSGYSPCSVCH